MYFCGDGGTAVTTGLCLAAWTNQVSEHRGRRLAGECRMPGKNGSKWSQLMALGQLEHWFGFIPDFVIVIDADLAQQADDDAFCALIEHELYHAAQDEDIFGSPRFTKQGDPGFTMRGHDVEQFVGVVERYGAAAAGVSELVAAAKRGPILQDGAVSLACGTCARKAA